VMNYRQAMGVIWTRFRCFDVSGLILNWEIWSSIDFSLIECVMWLNHMRLEVKINDIAMKASLGLKFPDLIVSRTNGYSLVTNFYNREREIEWELMEISEQVETRKNWGFSGA